MKPQKTSMFYRRLSHVRYRLFPRQGWNDLCRSQNTGQKRNPASHRTPTYLESWNVLMHWDSYPVTLHKKRCKTAPWCLRSHITKGAGRTWAGKRLGTEDRSTIRTVWQELQRLVTVYRMIGITAIPTGGSGGWNYHSDYCWWTGVSPQTFAVMANLGGVLARNCSYPSSSTKLHSIINSPHAP